MTRAAWWLGASAIVLTGLMTVGEANAQASCACVYNAAERNANRIREKLDDVKTSINDNATSVGDKIVDAILKSTQQLSAYESRSTETQARVTDAAQVNETVRQRQVIRAAAEGGRFDPAASACSDLSGIVSFNGGAPVAGAPGGNDVANVNRNRARGAGDAGAAVRQGGLALAQQMIKSRDTLVNVGGVLDPTADVRLLTENVTLDTSDEKIASALAQLVNNIVDPLPSRPITQSELTTPQAYAQVAARQIELARRSPANALFAYYGDLVAPTGGTEMASWAKGAVNPSYGSKVGDKVSTMQAMEIFVWSRFANPEWHQKLAKMSPEAVMREIALTEALSTHIQWMQFQLQLRDAAVNATSLVTSLDGRDSSSTSSIIRTLSEGSAAPTVDGTPVSGVMNISADL